MKTKITLLALAFLLIGAAQPPPLPTLRESEYAELFDDCSISDDLHAALMAGAGYDDPAAYFRGRRDAWAQAATILRNPAAP